MTTERRFEAEEAVESHTGEPIPGQWVVVNTEAGAVVTGGLTEAQARDLADELNAA